MDVVAPLAPDDAGAVAELLEAAEEADGYPSVSEQARIDVAGIEPAAGAGPTARSLLARSGAGQPLVGVGVLDGEHRGAGRHQGQVEEEAKGQVEGEDLGGRRWALEMAVHPLHRDARRPIEEALVEAATAEVERGGGQLAVWVRGTNADGAWLEELGFLSERQLLQLRAPLPVVEGRRGEDRPLDVRPFHPGRDEAAWLEVNRRAFAGHPEQGSWTAADLERREQASWFDPRGFLLHEADHRMAGFCWTKIHRVPVLGEIYVIGVDPDFQGRGLGRALTLAGLDHLAARGVPEAMLYVEGSNVAALALYRSLGFTEHHHELQFAGETTAGDQVDAPTARPIP